MGDHDIHDTALIEASLDALIALGPDARVVAWNAAAESIFGQPRAAAIGRPLVELAATRDDAGRLGAAIDATGAARATTIQFAAPGGVEIEASLRRSATGAITVVARDVSRRRQLAAAAELAAGIGQDLRSPLTVI